MKSFVAPHLFLTPSARALYVHFTPMLHLVHLCSTQILTHVPPEDALDASCHPNTEVESKLGRLVMLLPCRKSVYTMEFCFSWRK